MREESKYPLALRKGTILSGRYVLNRVLGQGGFGITYEAQDYRTKQLVAIKEYFPESAAARSDDGTVLAYSEQRGENFLYGKQCFLKEAETLAALNGTDGVVRVFTYFEENGTAYFAMEFVRGRSLQQYISEHGGAIRWNRALEILAPVMDALARVHARGIIHRDVKPENIFLAGDGSVRLIDFGAARYSMGEKSHSLDVLLTHGFAPWEQYSRHARQGPYTDIYGLAATFYYAVTGQIPPDAVDRVGKDELLSFHSLNIDIPARVESAIWKALAVRPEDRFQDVGAFQRALGNIREREEIKQPFEEDEEGQSKEEDEKEEKVDIHGKPKWWLAAVGVVAAICIAVAVFAGFHIAGTRSGTPEKTGETQREYQEYEEQAPQTQGKSPEEEVNNAVKEPSINDTKQGYTVVDGRDSGIILHQDGSTKGK